MADRGSHLERGHGAAIMIYSTRYTAVCHSEAGHGRFPTCRVRRTEEECADPRPRLGFVHLPPGRCRRAADVRTSIQSEPLI
jgi:hypothetical protein